MKEPSCLHTPGTLSFSDHQAIEGVASMTDHLIGLSRRLCPETSATKGMARKCDHSAETCQVKESHSFFVKIYRHKLVCHLGDGIVTSETWGVTDAAGVHEAFITG